MLRVRMCFGLLSTLIVIHVTSQISADDSAQLVGVVIELLSDNDQDMRALGLEQVRTASPGEAATRAFAEVLPKLSPAAQVGLLKALTVRGDNAARSAVVLLLSSTKDADVRVEAIRALGDLGTSTDLPKLLQLLDDGTTAERSAAKTSLVRMPGQTVSRRIASGMKDAAATTRVALIDVLTTRWALEAIPLILVAAVSSESQVRKAAMASLGKIAGPEHIAGMVQGVLKATPGSEQATAEKQIMFVCARAADPAKRSAPLVAAINKLNTQQRLTMLSTLGRVGGSDARSEIEAAIKSSNSTLHTLGIRAISNWPDASIAPRLMQLAKTDSHSSHRTTALRALMRVAPLSDARTDGQRLTLLKQAVAMASADRERILALDRARAIRTTGSLRFILPYVSKSATAEQACLSIVELAHHRTLREPNKVEFATALDLVIKTSKNATVIDRAERYKKDQTWVRPGS
ncbi:MAG TPA: HEAT repeat domain-containing protein [Pirellulaceae bacterium]|nr:HEAT repeat domain-containing protein [Pirellulaceae bacterium]